MNFIMLPNNLIWNKENTMIEKYGEKVSYVLSYLDSNVNRLDKCTFSIEDIILSCGIAVKTGKGKSIEQFKELLLQLQEDGIITNTNIEIEKAKIHDYISCDLKIPFEQKEENNVNFFMIERDKFINIITSDTKSDKCNLLNTYYYIMARINRKFGFFYDTQEIMASDLGLSKTTLNKYIDELKNLGVIYYDNIGLVDGKKANNIYSDTKEGLNKGLESSGNYYGAKTEVPKVVEERKEMVVDEPIQIDTSIYTSFSDVTGKKLNVSEKGKLDDLVKQHGEEIILKAIKRKSSEIKQAIDNGKIQTSPNNYFIGIIKNSIDEIKSIIEHEKTSEERFCHLNIGGIKTAKEQMEEYKQIEEKKKEKEKGESKVADLLASELWGKDKNEEDSEIKELLDELNATN